MEKQTIAIIILGVLLVGAIGYISVGKYQQSQSQKQLTILQQGVQLGYQQAVEQLIQQAATCNSVPVTFKNQTINMIAVECLQQRQQ